MSKLIYAVVGDLGAAHEVVAAAAELERRGHVVRWFADSAGKAMSNILLRQGIAFSTRGPELNDHPDALLIGTNAAVVAQQISWTDFGRKYGIPTVWLEDFPGTGERLSTRRVSPDLMLVNDVVSAGIVSVVRPGLRTIVVGKPTFADFAERCTHRETIRKIVREQLGVDNSEFLITFWSDGEILSRVEMHLRALTGLGTTGRFYRIAARIHPKLPDDFRQQMIAFAREHLPYVDADSVTPDDLTLASDAVVADWGCTGSFRAVLALVPTIVTMFPDDRDRRREVGYPEGVPPLVRSGSVGVARNAVELVREIEVIPDDGLPIEVAEQRRAPYRTLLEPGAATRIADAVLSLV